MGIEHTIWLRLVPATVRARIVNRPNLMKAMSNTAWLFGDRILRMGFGLLVGVWIARYLGPEQFGLLNYSMAFVALFGSVATLGLNGIVVRDLVREPGNANSTLGTAFVLQLLGGLTSVCFAIIFIYMVRPQDAMAKYMVTVLSLLMVFKSAEVVKYWYESQVKSKYVVWVENAIFLMVAMIKLVLIFFQAPLIAFVWATITESAFVAVGLLTVYSVRSGKLLLWQPSFHRALILIKESWPLILSGFAVMIYMRIDQIMLGQILGDKSVGIYTAAVRISEVWYFIPMAIVSSAFPAILESRKYDKNTYDMRLRKLYELLILLSICIAIICMFISDWFITILFGSSYILAGEVLAIHIWAGVIVSISFVHSKWLVAEGLVKYTMIYTIVGSCTNVFLNFLLIPHHGISGAAFATVMSQFSPLFIQLFLPKTRAHFYMIIGSFLFIHRLTVKK